jgi:hypothetical protein
MKKIIYLLVILLVMPTIMAIDLDVEKLSENEVMIVGLDDPIPYEINITNNGKSDEFKFYTFFGLGIKPEEFIEISSGESKKMTLYVYPFPDTKMRGNVIFSYFIRSKDKSKIEKKLSVKIIELGEAFKIGSQSIYPESNELTIYFENKVNYNFENLSVKFSSAFFDFEESFSLGPQEKKEFKIQLDKEKFKNLMAGFYTLSAKVSIGELTDNIEEKIIFEEKDLMETKTNKKGFIISTKIIETKNNGNTIKDAETIIKKNIFSRLFTTFNPEPTTINREGAAVYYSWKEELNPGEVQKINVKTNWLLPFLLISFIVLIIVFLKKYSKTDLTLRKKVSFVNAKGGEFALKVTIIAEAMKHLENVVIADRLPPLVKVFNRFTGETPKRFHKSKKMFEWDFEELEKGERRIFSYIIYSKVGVLGKFALPRTTARFKVGDKEKEVNSNKAYFLANQKVEDSEQ